MNTGFWLVMALPPLIGPMIAVLTRGHNFSGKHFHFDDKSGISKLEHGLVIFQAVRSIIAVSETYSLEKGENV
ncbi:hypothetical protein [Paracoccus sp. SSK6]|uniref:hypothetical protein n=1 Tax=Paracoccus sp. SSK6 TaxID=3143131 RepID=UPI0032194E0F